MPFTASSLGILLVLAIAVAAWACAAGDRRSARILTTSVAIGGPFLVYSASDALEPSYPPLLIGTLVAIGTLLAIGKLVVLQQLAGLNRGQHEDGNRGTTSARDDLLPFQQTTIESLTALLKSAPLETSQLVQLEGRLGEGKSFVLRRMEGHLADGSLVVYIDVWKHQSEHGIHTEVVRQVLAHPALLFPFGWLSAPLRLLLGSWFNLEPMRLLARLGRNAEVAIPITPPRLVWQRTLEHAVSRARNSSSRVVIVLDEIDRATPDVAQSALTLIPRSLDLPSVSVVLAYVGPIIHFKAFHPAQKQLRDLESTSDALLYAYLDRAPAPTGELDLHFDRPRQLHRWLVRRFNALDPGERAWLQARFAEKYLGRQRVAMSGVQPQDIAHMMTGWSPLDAQVRRVIDGVSDGMRAQARERIRATLVRHTTSGPHVRSIPPLRTVWTELARALAAVAATEQDRESSDSAPSTLRIDDLAGVAVVALDRARWHEAFAMGDGGF